MDFRPSGSIKPTSEPQGDCRGRKSLVQHGAFVGVFEFRGEHEFTSVNATRAKGLSVRSFREVCKGEDAGANNGPNREVTLNAKAELGRRTVRFRAATRQPEDITEFEAGISESRGRIEIERLVISSGEQSEFSQDFAAGSAEVDPPPPFSGTASLKGSETKRGGWTGSLSARVPGFGSIALAGRRFSARLQTVTR